MADTPALVARVITRLNVGGPTRHVAQLMAGLDPAAFRQVLFTGPGTSDEHTDLIAVPGERVLVPELGREVRLRQDWLALRSLVRHFRRLRPDLVHTHQGKAGLLGRLAARRAGVPVIVHTYHGHTFEGYFGPGRARLFRAAERYVGRRSSALIVQAPAQRADIVALIGADRESRVHLIPPGVDAPELLSLPRTAHAGRRRVLVPARLVPIKDPALALAVARLLPPDFDLIFAGDGPLRAGIEGAIEADAGLRGRVRVVPFEPSLARLYAGADVVLLTSRSEGTPLALIEAQIAGVPVVAPDVGATRSVVHPAGGQVVARDAAALADAVVAAARGGPLPETVRREVATTFRTARLHEEVAALYRTLVAEAGRSGRPARVRSS